MCKLAAISFDETYKNDPVIPLILMGEMLIEQCGRINDDGTGIGICTKDNLFIKHWADAPKFVFSKQVKQYLLKYGSLNPLIGHVRNATNGDKKDGHYLLEDAHPFIYGHIMGMHNGHFTNYKEIQKEKKLDLKGATIDSAVFFSSLAENLKGQRFNIDALNKTVGEFEGSFTCLIHDSLQPGTIWAAKGTNMLCYYLWEELNLLILATSPLDIKDGIKNFVPRYNLYRDEDLTLPEKIEPDILETHTLHKIEGLKINKVAGLETMKTPPKYTQYTRRYPPTKTKVKPDQLRAEALIDLEVILCMDDYEELDIIFKSADIESWWEADPEKLYSVVALVDDYLLNILDIKKDTEKLKAITALWKTCKSLYGMLVDCSVDTLDSYIGITMLIQEIEPDFYIPYFFNSQETLEKIKECLIGLVSSPIEGENG